jgi:lipopolysaccharide export system protein LptC
MSVTRMPTGAGTPGAGQRRPRMLGAGTRTPPSAAAIARRRWIVALTKRLLPLLAVALLATVALWPEYHRDAEQGRVAYRRSPLIPESGQLTDARYHGVDEHGRPYTITATVAHQLSPERIDLTRPAGDVSLESGTWLMVRAQQGVYLQHAQQLDLSGKVFLYRDDGTSLVTDSASLDLKAGAAAGAAMTHAEGPFGTLDAQGFAATDGGTVIRFTGPGRLVLNGKQK